MIKKRKSTFAKNIIVLLNLLEFMCKILAQSLWGFPRIFSQSLLCVIFSFMAGTGLIEIWTYLHHQLKDGVD